MVENMGLGLVWPLRSCHHLYNYRIQSLWVMPTSPLILSFLRLFLIEERVEIHRPYQSKIGVRLENAWAR